MRGTIGRITPAGTITEFPLEWQDGGPYGITVGADGNLWFTERFRDQIGKITPQGQITEYPLPTPDAQPWDITALPNGDLWFTEENVDQVGRITQNGTIDEYPSGIGQFPTFIATGADGNVWFTEEIGNDIVRLDPSNPTDQTEFPLTTEQALPWDISPGPDGNLWFTELAGRNVGKITPQGEITEYPVPGRPRDRRDRCEPVRGQLVVHRERLGRRGGDLGRRRRGRQVLYRPVSVRDHRGAGREHVVLRRVRQRDRACESRASSTSSASSSASTSASAASSAAATTSASTTTTSTTSAPTTTAAHEVRRPTGDRAQPGPRQGSSPLEPLPSRPRPSPPCRWSTRSRDRSAPATRSGQAGRLPGQPRRQPPLAHRLRPGDVENGRPAPFIG